MSQRTAVIVQARVGSSRLPRKVLEELKGRTVLRRVLERCAAIKGIDNVCCAIPVGAENDEVAIEAIRSGASIFRGSETDVLDRYYQAALALDSDVVIRVTSDCPLLDPEIVAQVLRLVSEEGYDYACNNLPPTWPHGLDCEVFRFEWLERAAREAILPSEREHVTPFIRNHNQARQQVLPSPEPGLAQHRWTLDTGMDLVFLKALFERMLEGRDSYTYRCPLAIVESDSALAKLNSGQDRNAGWNKSLAEDAAWLTRK